MEVTGYPELAQAYRVSSVPKTVIADRREFVGAMGEAVLLEHVQQAAGASGASV